MLSRLISICLRAPVYLMLAMIAGCAPAEPYTIWDAEIRKPIGDSDKTSGYFVFTNQSGERIVLVGAESENIRAIEFHETVEVDGVLRMRRLDSVPVEQGETVAFVPGGRHMMLFGVGTLTPPVSVDLIGSSGEVIRHEFDLVDPTQIR